MKRMNLLASVALASLAMPFFCSPGIAQPVQPVQPSQPGGAASYPAAPQRPRNSSAADDLIREQNIAAAKAEQRRLAALAERDAFRKALDEDVAKRRLTEAQASEIYNGVMVDSAAVLGRVGDRAPALLQGVSGSLQIAADRTGNQYTSDINDPNFTQGMAESIVDLGSVGIALNQELIREIGPDLGAILTVFGDAAQKRVDFMKANGTVPPLYIENTQAETTRLKRVIAALPSRLDVADFTLTKARTDLDVNRDKYVDKLKPVIDAKRSEMVQKYGTDPAKWPKQTPAPAPTAASAPRMNDDGTYGAPLPWETQPAALPPTATTPPSRSPGATSPTSAGGTRTTPRGTVPPADPYAGLRVSPVTGGTAGAAPTGTTTPRPGSAAQSGSAPQPGPAPQQGNAGSRATQAAASSARPATTQPNAAVQPPLAASRTNIPTNTRTGAINTASSDLGIGATTRPSAQRTPMQTAASSAATAGAAGSAPPPPLRQPSAGASASSFTNAARVESAAGTPVYDPQVRGTDRPNAPDTIRVAAGFRGSGFIEVDLNEAIRQASRPTTPPKPLTQADKNAINAVLRGVPKNPDGSIDMAGGFGAPIDPLTNALKNLFGPKPASSAGQRTAAGAAAAAAGDPSQLSVSQGMSGSMTGGASGPGRPDATGRSHAQGLTGSASGGANGPARPNPTASTAGQRTAAGAAAAAAGDPSQLSVSQGMSGSMTGGANGPGRPDATGRSHAQGMTGSGSGGASGPARPNPAASTAGQRSATGAAAAVGGAPPPTTVLSGMIGMIGSLFGGVSAPANPNPTDRLGSRGMTGSASGGASGPAQRVPASAAQQRTPAPFVQPRQPGGPDYPLAPNRASTRAQQGAAQGQWTPGDSFGAAGAAATAASSATPPDAVDLAMDRIAAESDAAMAAWRDRAGEVYYDENGVIHAVPRDRPANPYRRTPTPLRPVDDSAWGRFERGLGSLSVLDLEPIYAGWNADTAPVGLAGSRGPSSAGSVGPSSAGNSQRMDWHLPASGYLSTELEAARANGSLFGIGAGMGVPTNWGGLDLASSPIRVSGNQRPPFGSQAQMFRDTGFGGGFNPNDPFGDNNVWRSRPLAETAPDLARQLYGPLWSDRPFQVRAGAAVREGGFSGGDTVGSLFNEAQLTELRVNGLGGLDRLLAQPFNVLLTWGAGAYDLDLHMTGPLTASADRFHIFYAARGSQTASPFAELIRDCICNSGSEVILTAQLVRGGVYRISVFNFGDQSAASLNLANMSDATIQIVRGGQAVAAGNGTTIVGGRVIYTGTAPPNQAGNTWVAAEIDARTGKIGAPNRIVQSDNSTVVR